ncbi:MAG: BON domain-containing protein [Pedobacter sp.]
MLKKHRIVGLLVCLVLLATFVGCASTSKQEGTGEYIDDTVITTKVKTAIFADSELKVLQINVETFKGEVQLSGFVDSRQHAIRAEEVARGVNGVVAVKNNLIVR